MSKPFIALALVAMTSPAVAQVLTPERVEKCIDALAGAELAGIHHHPTKEGDIPVDLYKWKRMKQSLKVGLAMTWQCARGGNPVAFKFTDPETGRVIALWSPPIGLVEND